MRLKYTGFRGNRGSRRGGARMSLIEAGLYLYYYPSLAALAVITQWLNGVSVEWEIDDDTRQPLMLYLTPAAGSGLLLKKGRTGSAHISLSTSQIGDLEQAPLQSVEETVTPTEIAVRFPFKLRRTDQAAQ
jgi:hypothetical protein